MKEVIFMLQLKDVMKRIDRNIYELAFLVAFSSTLASYVLSQVVELVPCTLCWYSRIFMFPLPFILGAAVLRGDKKAYIYALPLAVIGAGLSFYHSLLQWGVITEEVTTCSLTGPSCAEPEILWLGFLTIPFGAFLSFAAIAALLIRSMKQNNGKPALDGSKQQMMQWLILVPVALTVIAVLLINLIG